MTPPMTPQDEEERRWLDAKYRRRPGRMTDTERKNGSRIPPEWKRYGG